MKLFCCVVMWFVLLTWWAGLSAHAAIPFELAPMTSADAARPVRVALDGDVAAVIEIGFPDPSGNIRTYYRESGTNWVALGMLPAPGNVFSVDVDRCLMALGTTGRVDVWFLNCGNSKPTWFRLDPLLLTNSASRVVDVNLRGERMALLVSSDAVFGSDQRVYVYDYDVTSWVYRAQVTITNSGDIIGGVSSVAAVSLSGNRLAVSSTSANLIRIHEKDAGGVNAWGAVATITNRPAGLDGLGYSLALDDTRLAASAFVRFPDRSSVLVYSNHTGGAGNWGLAGTLLNQPAHAAILTVDARHGRLAVMGLPAPGGLIWTGNPAPLWVYGGGAGPGGWALQSQQNLGEMNWSYFSLVYGSWSALPHPSISSNRVIAGVSRTNKLGQVAGWAASVHEAGTGGVNQWGREHVLGVMARPHSLGHAVALHGNFLVTGMPGDSWNGTNTGSVYVWYLFDQDTFGSGWLPVARLTDGSGAASNRFGAAVSVYQLSNLRARVAVGAPGVFDGKGEVHVFDVDVVGGQMAAGVRIVPLPYDNGLQFGASVAVWSNRVAVGAPGKAGGAGALYLFERDIGGVGAWGPLRTNAPPSSGFGFGTQVDMVGSTLVVTRPFTNGAGRRVFVYRRDTGGAHQWGLEATLSPPPGSPAGFGASVDLPSQFGNPSMVAIGATGGGTGVVYVMGVFTGSAWEVIQTIPGPDEDGPSFGSSVAMMGVLAVGVGAPQAGTGGRVRLFGWTLTNTTMMAVREGAAGDQWGRSLAGFSIYLAVGAPLSDTNGMDAGLVRTYRIGSYEIWAGTQPPGFASNWFTHQDWDGDGDANLHEFAMGTDPMNPASNRRLLMRREREGAADYMGWLKPDLPYNTFLLDYNIQSSVNMESWSTASYVTSITNGSLRLYSTGPAFMHYRFNPRYPVMPEAGDGPGGPILLLGH